jgi:hypothetical protein
MDTRLKIIEVLYGERNGNPGAGPEDGASGAITRPSSAAVVGRFWLLHHRFFSTLAGFEEKAPGQYLLRSNSVVEIEGEDRPALVAETLVLLIRKT